MTNPSSSSRRAALAAALIVAAGAAGFGLYQWGRGSDSPALTADPASDPQGPADPAGTAEPPRDDSAASTASAGTAARAVPDVLPDITLADRNGNPTALKSFGGRPLMVNFWATWCAPCRREIPLLNRLRAERKAQGAEIVGVAVDFREDVLAFVQKVPLDYPLLIGEEDGLAAAEAFGMGMAFPFSVFVDHENRILTVKVGELHEDEANFAFDRLHELSLGKTTREAAQAQVGEAFREMAAARAKAAH